MYAAYVEQELDVNSFNYNNRVYTKDLIGIGSGFGHIGTMQSRATIIA